MKNNEQYRIIPNGDKIEQLGWPLFGKEKFPNYEIFWQDFVTPTTNRSADITNIHFNDKSKTEEREISSIHYAIFHNFYFIYSGLGVGISREFFDFSFIKLANTCDLMEEFLFKLMLFQNQIDSQNTIITEAISKFKIPKLTAERVLKELCKRGSSTIPVIDRLTILKNHYDLKEYSKLSSSIRHYRNIIAHSWQSFQIDDKVPKVEFVKEYQDWLKVTEIVKSNNTEAKRAMIDSHFISMTDLIRLKTDKLIVIINKVWEEIIDKPNNKQLVKQINRVLGANSSVPSASGTFEISSTISSGIINGSIYEK